MLVDIDSEVMDDSKNALILVKMIKFIEVFGYCFFREDSYVINR